MNLSDVKAELKRGLKVYEAFAEADAIVKILDGAEQAAREAAAKAVKLEKQNAEAQEELEAAKAEAAKAKAEAQAMQDKAREAAYEIVNAAKSEGSDILYKAKAKAEELLFAAKEAQENLSDANAQVSAANAELADLQAKKEQFIKSLGA
jgi:ABC-type transporter Mla subunit MlaD